MSFPLPLHRDALSTMADGTIKQVNPFSGTQVWTVPGRGNRPLSTPAADPKPLSGDDFTHACNFCEAKQLATPPEKSRMVRNGEEWRILRNQMPHELEQTRAEFRRVPNLFEIVSYQYWKENYGYEITEAQRSRMDGYLADHEGREHIYNIVRTRLKASGHQGEPDEATLMSYVPAYFAGGHV